MSPKPPADRPDAPHQPASDPRAEATRRQGLASDPAVSAWVSANAGSGKTHVLARRVIRLLLAGTPPARILCLTYTKAAAANMANRVLDILAAWVGLSDADLDAALLATAGTRPTPELRARARRLFAAALETPGGLKIQTIHAFCGGLLHRFPFEAEVAAGFSELDDTGRAALFARIRAALVVEAAADPEAPLGAALARLMTEMSDFAIDRMLEAAIGARARILALGPSAAARRAQVAARLDIDPGASSARVGAEILESCFLPRTEWPGIADEIARSDKKTDQDRANALRAAFAAGTDAEALAAYRDVFFKKDQTPRSDKDLVTKAVAEAFPDLHAGLIAERDRLAALDDELRAALVLERTEAALMLGAELCRRYARDKAVRGLLDFDDLIARAVALLERVPASFVHYKLDQGIDHVLVDEAQDTSPEQWKVVRGLTDDFFSGAGARAGVTRTIFVVGDEKQSIFSFQGADPRAFGEMRALFAGRAGAEGFRRVELPHSFRSAPGVLEAVDTVFRPPAAHAGLSLDAVAPAHAAIRADAPALVEIWPTVTPEPRDPVDDWRRPLDAVPADDPANGLARRIAGFIRAGIEAGLAMPARGGRAMQAGDVLVLVRRRGKVFEAVIRALKELKDPRIAVAGADRLVVTGHIAALDLMALGDALVSPDDDLALACVLKSPLFGFTDDDLIALCPNRGGRLLSALAAAPGRPAAAAARLARWRRDALALRPFDFYARILGRDGGRAAILARLGPEAADVLDEFMTLARTYEQTEAASLAGFLAALRAGAAETRRDMDSGRNEVRVMTVHGAKGLEAPVVILADTVDVPRPRTEGGFVGLGTEPAVPVLALRQGEDPLALTAARAEAATREMAEYRRLLYVALTRAEDALIVCGAEQRLPGKDKPHARAEGCWYDLVGDALGPDLSPAPALGFAGEVLRWAKGAGVGAGAGIGAAMAQAASPAEAATALAPLPPSAPPPRRLRPSAAHGVASQERAGPAAGPAESLSPLMRGDLVHRLLAALPEVPEAARAGLAGRLLAFAAPGIGEPERAGVLAEAMGVLGHAPCAELFGAGSRAEVPVIGRLVAADGNLVEVSGRLDRLMVAGDRVILIDFKTDRVPPETPQAIAAGYVDQLALYGALLRRIYPRKQLEARLVFTRGPRVFTLEPQVLEAALARLLASPASPRRDAP
mgnify:CR=1 FL=1